MRHSALFALGVLLLLLQENCFRLFGLLDALISGLGLPGRIFLIPGITPALIVPLLIYLGGREYPLLHGAALSFVLGYTSDVIGVVPTGLYTFSMVTLFLLTRALGLRLATQTKLPQMLVTAGFTLAKSGVVLVCLGIFAPDGYVARSVYPYALPHMLSTALFSPLVFALAERVYTWTQTSSHGRSRGLIA